ncbi:hypothetical protein VTK73DRAFT_980 [Phialemonium thermophilum]|uniref:Uncharacterized protein n=1 Tax=Phialemonium thermophilum TaxID=223376 RepID=A0ABR3XCN1_9PEZI
MVVLAAACDFPTILHLHYSDSLDISVALSSAVVTSLVSLLVTTTPAKREQICTRFPSRHHMLIHVVVAAVAGDHRTVTELRWRREHLMPSPKDILLLESTLTSLGMYTDLIAIFIAT